MQITAGGFHNSNNIELVFVISQIKSHRQTTRFSSFCKPRLPNMSRSCSSCKQNGFLNSNIKCETLVMVVF